MSDVNVVIVSGTVVELGDIVQAGNSKKRSVRVRSVREFQGRDGNVKSSQVFADIDLWGDAVDRNMGLTIETKVLVTGRLNYDSWTDESGTKRYKTTIRPDSIEVLGIGNAPQQSPSSYNPYPQQGQGFAPPQQPYGGSYQGYQQGYQQQQAQAPQSGYCGQQQPQNPYGPYATAPQQVPAPQQPPFQPINQGVQPQQNAAPAPQQAQAPQGDDKPSDLPF